MKQDWIFEQYVKDMYKNKLKPDEFYWDGGNLVFTETYHKRRGFCCGNKCKHCPYTPKHEKGCITVKDISA